MKCTVYKLKFEGSDKFYVGSTGSMSSRIRRHRYELKYGKHHNSRVQELYDTSGAFTVELVKLCDSEEEAHAIEEFWIRDSNALNIGMSSVGGDNLSNNPDRLKIIRQIRKTLKSTIDGMSDEDKKAKYGKYGTANGMFGKTHSEEAKQSMSKASTGNTYALGSKRSEEVRLAMSDRAKLRVGDKNPFYGRVHSEETRLELSLIAKERAKTRTPANTRKVIIDNTEYASVTVAAKELNVSPATILYRIKNWNNYSYVDKCLTTIEPLETIIG